MSSNLSKTPFAKSATAILGIERRSRPTAVSLVTRFAALKAACPDGVDVYFDNTSGSITDTVYNNLAIGARCVVCGTASISVWDPLPTGPRVERTLLVKRARIQGLYVFDFEDQWGAAQKDLCQWFEEGKLNYREDILDGLEHAPGSIQRLYDGENQGKLLIEI